MKKEYMEPQMEAIEIKMGQQMLAGSVPTSAAGNGDLDPVIGPGSGNGRAPGLFEGDAWDALLGE